MAKKQIKIQDLEHLNEAAQKFEALMDGATIYAFRGEMGAGKTTFIRELCNVLGVDVSEASSPSFSLINEYRSDTTAELMYHFDLYRLESLEEALEIGVEDYLDCGALCFIEWPDRIADILPEETVDVLIEENPDGSRTITIDNLPEEEAE